VNGARAIAETLLASGVDTCFMNPGTSEMQFVAALDDVPDLRSILVLFEGVASGAADGYARMAGRPAATLLHLGAGLTNAAANLHNARRAGVPMVNLVGDHARAHAIYDSPLQSDIAALAMPVSKTVQRIATPEDIGPTIAETVANAIGPPPGIATVIVPADLTWQADVEVAGAAAPHPSPAPNPELVSAAVAALRNGRSALLLGGDALHRAALAAAERVVVATGCRAYVETFPARLERGPGCFQPERLAYFGEFARKQLADLDSLVLVGARTPVSFFAYPDQPSTIVPPTCTTVELIGGQAALEALATELGGAAARHTRGTQVECPTGDLTARSVAAAVAATLPAGAIVVDEGNTAGRDMFTATEGVVDHDWLTLTGGAIGVGLPMAVGAAVACPGRPVLCLEADGSSLYTIQALWTMAREQLDVTILLLDNAAYGILRMELARVGAGTPGPTAARMLELGDPAIDFVSVARGLGLEAREAMSADELCAALRHSYAEPGPHLVRVSVV
jgi:acetolactate synthase I/II/III large subunit